LSDGFLGFGDSSPFLGAIKEVIKPLDCINHTRPNVSIEDIIFDGKDK
jgi:hypothetical protein